MRKGIILSGGLGTRLYPCTKVISKQLLPVYDKPLVYYPISTLMMAGIRDIMIITSPADRAPFENLIGDGSQWGLNITYATQLEPKGIAECFRIAEKWIGRDDVTLILGDNIFYGNELINRFNHAAWNNSGATLFAYHVADPATVRVTVPALALAAGATTKVVIATSAAVIIDSFFMLFFLFLFI